MLGFSYGQVLLLIGGAAALVGTKDLPLIARTAGRLAGRAIGYVQLARGQLDSVLQQSQAKQVHKELQDTMAQLEAIRYEIRSISLVNPGPMTRQPADIPSNPTPINNGNGSSEKCVEKQIVEDPPVQDYLRPSSSINLHSQATAYAKLAELEAVKSASVKSKTQNENLSGDPGLFVVLPVSAESAGLLPDQKDSAKGSDIVLGAVLEAEVARNAKDFFAQPENQIKGI